MQDIFSMYLVTGATGFLGRTITRKLVDEGKSIRALVLQGDNTDGLPDGVETVEGRVDDRESLSGFFSGELKDACLIHCAGLISIASAHDPDLRKVNVEGTKNIMDLCLERHVKKVVYVSSVHAVPEKPDGEEIKEIREFSARKVRGQYAKSKAEGTAYALRMAGKGLDVSVVHPSAIIGPDDPGKGYITSTIISFCMGMLPAAVKGGYDFADVRDVAEGVIACCRKGRSGECYFLTGHYATLDDILGYIRLMGYGKDIPFLPLWMVKAVSPFFELSSILKEEPMFLTPYSAYTMGSNALFSHRKASIELGYRSRDLECTIRSVIGWLSREGMIPGPDRKVQAEG